MKVHNKKSLEEIRRSLRQNVTQAEDFLWQELRNNKLAGLKFKRQHSIGNYIVDFYCASKRLIVEADGNVHETKEQKEKDQFRDENLFDMDFKVLRFTNHQILFETDYVKEEIVKHSLYLI
jgi:very-short-patch-repair endonuclease